MDSQLKRGILETCVLAVLAKGDSYGYQIGADMAAVIEISESTLYSILKRLKRRGYASEIVPPVVEFEEARERQ